LGQKPLFNILNGSSLLRTLFIKSKYINFLNESEFQREALRYLYTNAFKRRVFYQIVSLF
jgi:hypothetical protein